MSNLRKKLAISFGIIVVIAFVLVGIAFMYDKGVSDYKVEYDNSVLLDETFVDADGNSVNMRKLNKVDGATDGGTVSIYSKIPDNIKENDCLCLYARHVYYKIYINDELIYVPYYPTGFIYNKGIGHNYAFIEMRQAWAGKTLRIEYNCSYPKSKGGITNVRVVEKSAYIADLVSEKIIAFVVSIMLLFIGIIYAILDIPASFLDRKNHEILYLGLFAFFAGVWSLSETKLIQVFCDNSRVMNIVSCVSLMLIPLPTILYAEEAYKGGSRLIKKLVCGLAISQIVVCFGLHVLGIMDLKSTLFMSHCIMIIGAIYIVYLLCVYSKSKRREIAGIYKLLKAIGAASVVISTIIDLLRYYSGYRNDQAFFVRVGMFIFVICYGVASLDRAIEAAKLGLKNEIISRLAYEDGLTGVGNYTAYKEYLSELQNKINKDDIKDFCSVMFDVNYLKQTNDTLGHHCGDKLIVSAASTIDASFKKGDARCFRIGGDEFVVIMSGDDLRDKFEKGKQIFLKKIEDFNADEKREFDLSIAFGTAIASELETKVIKDICRIADKRMYKYKKKMKAER